jgi:VWFA-related protein
MSKWALAGLVAAGMAWLAFAQSPAAPVIKLNVVAVDARGQSVVDLTRDDFQVYDAGKLQRIASFHRNDVKPLHVLPRDPNESSNRTGAPLSRATVILLDLLNAQFSDRAYAVNQLIPALQRVEATESLFLYILAIDGSLYPIHPLPDPETAAPDAAKPWTEDVKRLLDEASRKLFVLRPFNLLVDERVHMTYDALETLATRIALGPGRKSIIWISHGMPISIGGRASGSEEIDYTPLLQRLTATLDRDNVAVYPVRLPQSLAPATANMPGAGMGSTETLYEFAGLTGGRAFLTVDIAGAIAQAASDARMSYLLAFEPGLDKWDGKYHKLRVTCSRKGVRLKTKEGYYAFAGDAHDGDQETAAIRAAISSPFDVPEIGLYARLTPDGKTPQGMTLALRIDAADVQLVREGDHFTAQMGVEFSGYLADGSSESTAAGTFTVRLKDEEREQAMQKGLLLERHINLPPTIRKLRAIVYDRASGAIGSLTVAVPGATP